MPQLEIIQKKFKFKIDCIQTDNGSEFTNRLNSNYKGKKTMFEMKLEELGIEHKLIKPKTPRHNGKVERKHTQNDKICHVLSLHEMKGCVSRTFFKNCILTTDSYLVWGI